MGIFNNKSKIEVDARIQLTDKQISDAKPKFREMIKCIREYGILDYEIIEALKQNASKRVLEDGKLFKF